MTALATFGVLLDRSIAQIADTRDRATVITVADVWDNNTFALFRAASAVGPATREQYALAALAWMADLGVERRSWMMELAGPDLANLLPPAMTQPHSPPSEPLDGAARVAAVILHEGMLWIRLIRYDSEVDSVPVLDLCSTFTGAGEAILAAGARRSRRQRQHAFRRLVEVWIQRGGPTLAPWFAAQLRDLIDAPGLPRQACKQARTLAQSTRSS